MNRTLPAVAALMLLAPGAPALADGGKTVPGRCLAVVDGKTRLKGACSIGLEVGGGFTMQKDNGLGTYRVVPDKAAGTAAATWTPDWGEKQMFGPLKRQGACWADDKTKLCAWSGEAEMRKNRDAPYTDFHPLVGKPVQGYCHMGECEWFRYDSARLIDHNAHEALFEIREHSWVTEHPHDDYDRPRKPQEVTGDTFYARCSRTRPSFLTTDGKGGFDFAPSTDAGTYGVSTYIYVKYAAACHGVTRAITGVEGVELGYSPDGESAENETKLVDPKDALK